MHRKIKGLWGNEFIQGGFFLTASSMLVNLLNYFFYFIAGRMLGPGGYGEITALLSYSAIVSVPFTIVTTFLIQKISAAGNNQLNYAYATESYFWSRIKRYWYFWVIGLIITPLIPRLTNLSPVTAYFLVPLLFISLISSYYNAAFQGLRLFTVFAAIGALAALLKLAGAVSLIVVNNLLTILFFLLLSNLISTIISYRLLHNKKRGFGSPAASINKRLINILTSRYFLMTLFSVLSITILNNLDIIFVKKFFNPVESGIYNSWSLFAKIILYIVGPLTSISFVFFSYSRYKQSQNRILNVSLAVLAFIAVASYLGYVFFAKTFIGLLFGDKFLAVSPYLGQASIFGTFYTAITFINGYFLARKSRYSLILTVFLPLYFILLFIIPRQITNIINLNIAFSAVVTIAYIAAYFYSIRAKTLLYNSDNGK